MLTKVSSREVWKEVFEGEEGRRGWEGNALYLQKVVPAGMKGEVGKSSSRSQNFPEQHSGSSYRTFHLLSIKQGQIHR